MKTLTAFNTEEEDAERGMETLTAFNTEKETRKHCFQYIKAVMKTLLSTQKRKMQAGVMKTLTAYSTEKVDEGWGHENTDCFQYRKGR